MDPEWRRINLVLELDANGKVALTRKPVPTIRPDLLALFDREELGKYLTAEELPANCRAYILRVEELIGARISAIGVGPGRDEIIERHSFLG